MRGIPSSSVAVLAAVLAVMPAGIGAPDAAPTLTDAQVRGKTIYTRGQGAGSEEITATMGDGGAEVSASLLLCANCHAPDGQGRPEGGMFPSDIRWTILTKPYAVTSRSGRKRPAYDGKRLIRAITTGIDSGGTKLDDAMPRYRLTMQQANDLVAYLKVLGTEPERGVTPESITVGVLLAPPKLFPEIHRSAKRLLSAYAAQSNASGGSYGRKLDLRFLDLPEAVADRAPAARDFIDREQPFALLAGFVAGADDAIVSVVENRSVPMIGTITLRPGQGSPSNRHVFHLYSGIPDQAGALVSYAATKLSLDDPRAVVVIPGNDERMRDIAGIAARHAETAGWSTVETALESGADTLATGLPADIVLWLGNAEGLAKLLPRLASADRHPVVLAPGSLAGKDLLSAPPGFASKLFLSFPTLPSDQSPRGRIEFKALADSAGLGDPHIPTSLAVLASARLLAHSLQKSGRDLRARKLIAELEKLYQFPTGHAPLLTYSKSRRIGAAGAHIVAVDLVRKALAPTGQWMTPPRR